MSRAATVHPPLTRTPPPGGAFGGAFGRAAPALAAYLAVRLCGLAFLAHLAHAKGHGVWPALATSWDSGWYVDIAEHGYTDRLGTEVNTNNLAFFPLYPLLIRMFSVLSPASPASAGLLISLLCSLLAAWGIFAVGDALHGRRTGTVLAVLWGCLPVALVQWMGYTESLFTALAAWSLFAVVRERWLTAAVLACASGLARPTGIAVAVAVTLAALLACRTPGVRIRALTAAALAPLGWVAFVGWVGLRVGRPDGYFAVQRLWKNEWDGGRATLLELRQQLVYSSRPPLFLLLVSMVLIVSAVLFVLGVLDRQPLPLLVFSGVLLLVVLGSEGVYFPRARFLLPGFPLLLPLARALARARPPALTVLLTAAAGLSAWSGAYMLLVWQGPP
ncbi:mannosyltransferase family protein [Streptomyces sp. NPDC057638]|uniref:mannosyltransferase family protein n=1 Tax=Streptomyces sp. NPDC057638 TaxID=3346190 RepID=UPI00369EE2D1